MSSRLGGILITHTILALQDDMMGGMDFDDMDLDGMYDEF